MNKRFFGPIKTFTQAQFSGIFLFALRFQRKKLDLFSLAYHFQRKQWMITTDAFIFSISKILKFYIATIILTRKRDERGLNPNSQSSAGSSSRGSSKYINVVFSAIFKYKISLFEILKNDPNMPWFSFWPNKTAEEHRINFK